MSLFHFTSLVHWPLIDEAGVLEPSESNIDPERTAAGPAVVWLTDTPSPAMGHGLTGGAVDKTAVRIEVDVPAILWTEWEWTARMPTWWRDAIVTAGGGPEAASHWYVWPARIPRSRWAAVGLPPAMMEGVR